MSVEQAVAPLDSPKSPVAVEEADREKAVIVDKSTRIRAVVLEPIYKTCEPEYHTSVVLAAQKFGRDEIRFTFPELRTLIDTARDRLMHRFWTGYPNAERAIFIDSDHLVPNGYVDWTRRAAKTSEPERFLRINVFERLLSHPLDLGIIGAVYFDREYGVEMQCAKGCGPGKDESFLKDWRSGRLRGLMEMLWCGTGCLMIPRWVHGRLIQNVDRWPECVPKRAGERHGFFTRAKHLQGEDVAYAVRAHEIGIKSYLDTELRLWHKTVQFF